MALDIKFPTTEKGEEAHNAVEEYCILTDGVFNRAIFDALKQDINQAIGETLTDRQQAHRLPALTNSIKSRTEQMKRAPFSPELCKTPQEFAKLPRNLIKTMQELLVRKEDRIKITKEDLSEFSNEELMDSVIIDPQFITNKLLSHLGLEEYLPSNQTSRKSIPKYDDIRYRAEAIEAVRDMFKTGIEVADLPQQKTNHRLLRVTKGPQTGALLCVQSNGNQKKHINFYENLQSAYRRTDHAKESYEKEVDLLGNILAILKNMNGEAADENQIKSINEFLKKLQHVSNSYKVSISERLQGYLNPSLTIGARKAITWGIQNDIAKRANHSQTCLKYLVEDQQDIFFLMRKQSATLSSFYNEIVKYSERLKILKSDGELNEEEKERIVRNLKILANNCEDMNLNPYRFVSQKIQEKISELIETIEQEIDHPKEQHIFIHIFALAKLLHLDELLLALRQRYFHAYNEKSNDGNLEDIYVKNLIERLQEIKAEVENKQISGDVEMKDLSKPYGAIYRLLNQLIRIAGQSCKNDAATRVKGLKEINKRLKEFNLISYLEQI
ncbi:hypothetical protein KJ632_02055 [Patescibacteria group bacterium]|nr:hypothetical protein [Patescibacteria group bacterium]